MASSPAPLSPTLAMPVKRKRADTIDLTGDGEANVLQHNGQAQKVPAGQIDDDDFSDDGSMLEEILDEIELNPYEPGEDSEGLSIEVITAMRKQLRQVGPEDFIRKYLSDDKIPPRILGTAFGIDPDLIEDPILYRQVLGVAIGRAFRKRQKLMQYNTIDDAARLLKRSSNVMVITGAGISTSLGIPDFRSKGTGFYDKLAALGYQEPQEVFDIDIFDQTPETFFSLAGDILPNGKQFTPTHGFIKLLQDKGKLQTNYTQNIDNLETLAGVEKSRLIQCHGSFATATCRKCKHKVPGEDIFDDIRAKRVSYCKRCQAALATQPAPIKKRKPTKPRKNAWEDSDSDSEYQIPQAGVMKPDITFFGEQLPAHYFDRFTNRDVQTVDLVVVIGTSLKVAPVSEMPNYLPHAVPHIYISREPIQHINFDIQLIGDCDHAVFELCRRAGWDLRHEMIPEGLRVKVKPYEEGDKCRWKIRPKVKKVQDVVAGEGGAGVSAKSSSTLT